MATCNWCGKKGFLLQLSKSKFCYDCEGEVREHIKSRLAKIKIAVENTDTSLEEIETAINLIDYLETVRHKVPYFKSSNAEYKKALLEMKYNKSNKQHTSCISTITEVDQFKLTDMAANPVVPSMPTVASKLAMPPKNQCQTLYPQYQYDDILIAFSQDIDTSEINVGAELQLLPEPDNQYDAGAIMVLLNNHKIGYVPQKRFQQMIRDFWKRSECVTAHISGKTDAGLEMKLCFYRAELTYEQLIESPIPRKEFKLSGNNSEDMQDNISFSDVGDEIAFSYDFEIDKVVAMSSYDIGFVPKSLKDYIMDLDDYMAFISQIQEDDNGKYSVKVVVFEK